MIPTLEDCKSPLRPTGYNVVVAIDRILPKTMGGIIIPEKHREREDAASETGIIVAVSPMAFKGADWDGEPNPPTVGDTVLFQRYDGKEFNLDSETIKYRVISDAAVKGVIE